MGQAFQVVVTEQSGRVKVKSAIVGGGGRMTPQQLDEHYRAINAFPGAKSVEITELDGTITPPKLKELQSKQFRSQLDKQMRPLLTPKASITPKYVLPPEERQKYKNPFAVPFAGDGVGNVPINPGAIKAVEEATIPVEKVQDLPSVGGGPSPAASGPANDATAPASASEGSALSEGADAGGPPPRNRSKG